MPPQIRGKYEKSGEVNFFGNKCIWYARFVKDEESTNERYILDEQSVTFDLKEIGPGGGDEGELLDICKHQAKKEGYP